ncbi:hypothetical protein T01_15521 [Trichinella spiralis]|uniref:Uncharacterized protein n=1 Tax=Trichinella spiralis TaxID=6334 RepID=A0A0V1AZF2_TRISP|nr:hypothetical protein T01_15521 [Trichinella spiralis]
MLMPRCKSACSKSIASLGVTKCPNFDVILCWLFRHVLPEWTTALEWNEPLIHRDVRSSIAHYCFPCTVPNCENQVPHDQDEVCKDGH